MAVFSTGNPTITISSAKLDSTRSVLVYQRFDGASTKGVYARVAILDGSGGITFGSEYAITTSANIILSKHAVCHVGGNKIVVGYLVGDNVAASYIVGDVAADSTISWGSVQTNSSAYGTGHLQVCKLDTNKFCSFGATYSSQVERWQGCTISGTTITFGSVDTSGEAGYADYIHSGLAQLDTDKAVMAMRSYAGGSFTGKCRVVSFSGTTPTLGTIQNISDQLGLAGEYDVVGVSSTNFVICYRGGSNYGNLQAGTVSGTTITLGSVSTFLSAAIDYPAIGNGSGGKVYFAYRDGTNLKRGSASVSGNTLSDVSVDATVTASNSPYISIPDNLNGSFLLIAYEDVGNSNQGTVVSVQTVTSAVKTVDGLAKASVKSKNGLAIASVKSFNGLE